MKAQRAFTAAVLCLCLLLTACGSLSQSGEQARDVAKYNAYMEFLNFTSNWYEAMCNIYFEDFGTEPEPTLDNFDGFTLDWGDASESIYELYRDETEAPRGYQDAEPDYGETDARLLLFCDAFDRFNELYFRDVNAYYTNREYESDNFEKGRLFHAQMLEAYVAFAEAREDFVSAFQTQILAAEQSGLDELKEQGNLIHYYTRALISDSRAISDLFYEYEDAEIDFLDVDPERYEPLYAQFKADFEALREACADDSQLEKEGYTGTQSAFLTQYLGTAEQMLVAADDMRNMIAAGSEDIENELTGMFTTGGRNYPMSRFRQRLDMLISEYNNSIS